MILGNGIDIIEVSRIKKALQKNDRFLNKIFGDIELEYINSKNKNPNTIAGMFAAKEAISKAIGTGISSYKWTDIVIDHDKLGKPIAFLKNNAYKISKTNGIDHIIISITHINEYALAFAIAEGDSSEDFDISNLKLILPKRNRNSHKGDYGSVGVIAGSVGMTGANFLTSTSALRSGSGLVYSFIPKSLNIILETKTTEVITKPVEDNGKGYFSYQNANNILDEVNKLDVIALGPGIGIDEEQINFVKQILKVNKPIVLDADGINCITYNKDILNERKNKTIITPHPGELSRLINVEIDEIQNNRLKYAKLTSQKFNVITVLKGNETIVCDEIGNTYINKTGNPGMATPGSGDILTGMIASFIGQGIEAINSTVISVFLHGLAGDISAKEKGEYGMIATDILNNIPKAIMKITNK